MSIDESVKYQLIPLHASVHFFFSKFEMKCMVTLLLRQAICNFLWNLHVMLVACSIKYLNLFQYYTSIINTKPKM